MVVASRHRIIIIIITIIQVAIRCNLFKLSVGERLEKKQVSKNGIIKNVEH